MILMPIFQLLIKFDYSRSQFALQLPIQCLQILALTCLACTHLILSGPILLFSCSYKINLNGLTTQRYRLLAHQTRFEAKNLPRVGADKAHFNYSKFFNSSISGKACFNFSGISSEVLYVATPNGLS